MKENNWNDVSTLLGVRRKAKMNAIVSGFRIAEEYTERAADELIGEGLAGSSTQHQSTLENDLGECLNPKNKRTTEVHDADQSNDKNNNQDGNSAIEMNRMCTGVKRSLNDEMTTGGIKELIFGMGYKKVNTRYKP